MAEVQGSILLRKLRTGQTAQVSISTTKQLFQLYSTTESGTTCVPDFGDNNVKCSVNVVGTGVEVVSVEWRINGTAATAISGCSVSSNVLTIATNLAALLGYTSGTLTANVTLRDTASQTETVVTKTEPIRIQQATSSGYIVMIDATQTWVDGSHNATLTATVYNNGSEQTIGQGGLTVKWFAGNATTTNKGTSKTLTVTPDDVNGAQLFVCRAYSGGDEVDAEGVTVIDNSDEYHIACDATQYTSSTDTTGSTQGNVTSVNVDDGTYSTKAAFKVLDTNGNEVTATGWKCRKMHADTMKYISGSSASATSTADTDTDNATDGNTITVYDGDYTSSAGGNHLTEVICDAECTVGNS